MDGCWSNVSVAYPLACSGDNGPSVGAAGGDTSLAVRAAPQGSADKLIP